MDDQGVRGRLVVGWADACAETLHPLRERTYLTFFGTYGRNSGVPAYSVSMWMYPDKLTACQGILGESVEIVRSMGLPFAVVGGWSPFYLNNPTGLHPGSKDVDLLFSEAVEVKGLAKVVEHFLGRGYLPSAKHDFQLLRIVGGGKGQFVFNVDFLHPKESTVPLGGGSDGSPVDSACLATMSKDSHWLLPTDRSPVPARERIRICSGHCAYTPCERTAQDRTR
jgi:hypothetical protein